MTDPTLRPTDLLLTYSPIMPINFSIKTGSDSKLRLLRALALRYPQGQRRGFASEYIHVSEHHRDY